MELMLDRDAQQQALRIQAAAVAAQQAALLEEETRLQEQQSALTQQQQQLASHLEDKRQRLLELADQVQATRAALQRQRDNLDQEAARQAEELATRQIALDTQCKQFQARRHRARALRRRLQQRFERRLAAQRLQLHEREQAAQTQCQRLEQEWVQLKKEREALQKARLAHSGEAELSKRQLQAEWERLWQEVKVWHQDRDHKEADLAARARALHQREEELTDAARALADDRHQWQYKRQLLEQEVHGMESRLISQRHKLNEHRAQLVRVEATLRDVNGTVPPPAVFIENEPRYLEPMPAETPPRSPRSPEEAHLRELESMINQRVTCLDGVAENLADQRLELVEHWQRIARTQQEWLARHSAAAAELEALAARLPLQERALLTRQEALHALEDRLQQRDRELSQRRQHLEGLAARLHGREAAWQRERDSLLTDIQGREAVLDKQFQAFVSLRQRWTERRRQELQKLRAELAACEKLRHEFASLRQECWKRGLALEQQERDLSEKTLALEEYRQQFILRAHDAAGVESKLERLRKRWAQENAATMRAAAEQFQRLQQEGAQVQARGRELLKVAEDLTSRETMLVQRQVAWEEQITLAEAHQDRLRQQLQSMQAQRDRSDRHVAELQNEIERLARVLLDGTDVEESRPLAA
jgi:hypothetical protein